MNMRSAATYTRACAHLQSRTQVRRLARRSHRAAKAAIQERADLAKRAAVSEYVQMLNFCRANNLDPETAINFKSGGMIVFKGMTKKRKAELYNEAQKRTGYLAAIDRALPDDDDQESFDTQDQFSEVMAWVCGTAIVLAIIGLVAFSVGMTKP